MNTSTNIARLALTAAVAGIIAGTSAVAAHAEDRGSSDPTEANGCNGNDGSGGANGCAGANGCGAGSDHDAKASGSADGAEAGSDANSCGGPNGCGSNE